MRDELTVPEPPPQPATNMPVSPLTASKKIPDEIRIKFLRALDSGTNDTVVQRSRPSR